MYAARVASLRELVVRDEAEATRHDQRDELHVDTFACIIVKFLKCHQKNWMVVQVNIRVTKLAQCGWKIC